MRTTPFLGVLAAAALIAACSSDDEPVEATASTATTTAPTDDEHGHAGADEPLLVVADPEAGALHVYDADELELLGTLDGVHLAEHPGFLPTPDGHVLLTDHETDELLVLHPSEPSIEGRVPLPGDAVHLAIDEAGRFAAVSTAADDETGTGADGFTLVDLGTLEAVDVPLTTGEPGVAIGGEPLSVLHRNDEPGVVEAFPVDAVLAGDTRPSGTVAIDPFGHGEAVTAGGERLAIATDGGIDLVDLGPEGLAHAGTVPWAQDGRDGGRGYFFRLGVDGRHAFSYLRVVPEPQDDAAFAAWEAWGNDLYVADLEGATATRVELGPGLVYRFALADDLAFYVRVHPDGDVLHVVDADPGSPTFATVIDEVELGSLAGGPVAGTEPWAAEGRRVAARPDGATAYVTNGGEGTVSVVDVATGEITETLAVPTPLHLGGYVVAIDPSAPPVDVVGR